MGKRIAIALPAVVLISLTLAVVFAIPAHQEPRFVWEMGTMIGKSEIVGRHIPQGTWKSTYEFGADFETVVQAMRRDLKSPEWVWGESTTSLGELGTLGQSWNGWHVTRGDESFRIYKGYPSASGSVQVERYYIPREPSWLETQWSAFREWISGRSGRGE